MKCERCGEDIEEPNSEIEKIWNMCESCIHDTLVNVAMGIAESTQLTD